MRGCQPCVAPGNCLPAQRLHDVLLCVAHRNSAPAAAAAAAATEAAAAAATAAAPAAPASLMAVLEAMLQTQLGVFVFANFTIACCAAVAAIVTVCDAEATAAALIVAS